MYNYGIIDGNFFLRRNFSAAKRSKTFLQDSYTCLCASFLSTIFNYQQMFNLQNIIITWDKLPYKKLADITEYKQDRHYTSQEDIDKLNALIAVTAAKDSSELIKERDKLKYDLDCEGVFHMAKDSLITNLDGTHLKNIRMVGYEADDLAYLLSKHLAAEGNSCLLISVDSDWINFVDTNVSFYRETLARSRKDGKLYTKDTLTCASEVDALGCSLYEYGNLKEVYTGGHNNVTGYKSRKIPFKTFAKAMLSADESLPDYEYFSKRVKALNINNYDNNDVVMQISQMNSDERDDSKIKSYLNSLKPVLAQRYQSFGNPNIVGGFVLP